MTKLILASLAVVFAVGPAPSARHVDGSREQPAITAGARARMQASQLGPGWHTGHIDAFLAPGPVAGGVRCLAFVPHPPRAVSRVMITASDTLQIWVPRGADSAATQGSWAGVPREARVQASCQMG
jgi:hypothetical protein